MSKKLSSVSETTQEWAHQRGLECVFSMQTGSTNDDAKANAFHEENDFVLYLTSHQTAGRGRGANHWLDTGSGESLLCTWSFKVHSPPQAITGPRIGLALYQAAAKTWASLNWGLKPPNDLFLAGHKIGGLLIESLTSGGDHRLLIGLGLNVFNHPRKFAEAAHLSGDLQTGVDEGEWFQFLDELRAQFQVAVADCMKAELSPATRKDLARAINANPARPFQVQEVSPRGDLIHAQGTQQWMEI